MGTLTPNLKPGADPPSGTAADESESYRSQAGAEPLTGHTVFPTVKRFNRKTVGVLMGLGALVTIAALGTAVTRQHQGKRPGESSAQNAPAIMTTTDAINALPGDYAQVARANAAASPALNGPRATAEFPAFTPLTGPNSGAPAAGALRSLSPYEQALAAEQLEELKRAAQAREAGFGFGGATSQGGTPGSGSTLSSNVVGGLDHGLSSIAAAGLQQSLAARDADNRQDDKANFAFLDRKASWELREGMQQPRSPYTVFAGAVLPGVMITGINSDLPGQIEGQISQNVYDTVTGQHLLLPQGTKVLGRYDSRITYGQSRVLVVWTRLVRPDGSNIDLEGMPGVDMSGYSGETGNVDRHLFRLLSAVVLGSVIQAGTSAGTSFTNPSFADLARQGAGQGVNDATQQIVRKELNIQPTITVAPGTRFNVFTTKDMILPPYQG
jgi:type IV secretory pathway VirB10-like protein